MGKINRRMKKLLIVAVVLVVLLVVAIVGVGLSLDGIVKGAVEKVGPAVTKVDVTLDRAEVSVLNGHGALHGFALGNPEGYPSPTSVQFNLASLALQPSSLLSDKIVIRHVRCDAPVITLEGSLSSNNLKALLDGMDTGESEPEAAPEEPASDESSEASSRKLQVDEFTLTGAKLVVNLEELGDEPKTLALPDIRLTDLGTGPEGITAEELTSLVLTRVAQAAVQIVIENAGDLDQIGEAVLKQMDSSGNKDAANAVRGLMDMFKGKKDQ